jgi:hypothetical protein
LGVEWIKIMAFALAAGIAYGILHDQVTAHLCVEYFTVAHPPLFPRAMAPFCLAICWGIAATWWVALPLGLLMAIAARLGGWPKLKLVDLRRPILKMLGAMAVCALIAGIVGFILAQRGVVDAAIFYGIPAERHAASCSTCGRTPPAISPASSAELC